MNNISNIINYLYSNQSLDTYEEKLLNVSSILSSLSYDYNIPELVVVGSQSSGKSTVLNNIINMNILPTGKNMVTRSPIKLELRNNNKNIIEIGYNKNNMYVHFKKCDDINNISDIINDLTCKLFGKNNNIGTIPIIIKVNSKNVPNINLVDLPGLVSIACTDKGQPKDIKDQIRQLIASYIKLPNTIIIGIIPARADIEVDLALELIKEYDYNGERTIGVLTKLDLMNKDSNINSYLVNEISNDLQLTHGYFAIKNRINDADISETEYFNVHPIYKKSPPERLGILNLTKYINKVLISSIQENLPIIIEQIDKRLNEINSELCKYGNNYNNIENKHQILNIIITEFSQNMINAINNYGININYAKLIKDVFINYRTNIDNINPFESLDKDLINYIINKSESNHMFSEVMLIHIMEKCLQDKRNAPIKLLNEPSNDCLNNIINLLNTLVDEVIIYNNITNYNELCIFFKNTMKELINSYKNEINKIITNLINCEESYIWTESIEFKQQFSESTINNISNLCSVYYLTIKDNFKNNIPKSIMYHMIHKLEKNICTELLDKIQTQDINKLLYENDDTKNKRDALINEKIKLEEIKKNF
tara:strand:+ start:8849 stop:10636 length:1788 start_codon:yes stop_codon:yes gene_type:complete